jgi:hypothetical protein
MIFGVCLSVWCPVFGLWFLVFGLGSPSKQIQSKTKDQKPKANTEVTREEIKWQGVIDPH